MSSKTSWATLVLGLALACGLLANDVAAAQAASADTVNDTVVDGQPPYTLELCWVELTEGWCIRAKMENAAPGSFALTAAADIYEPSTQLGAPAGALQFATGWRAVAEIENTKEVFISAASLSEEFCSQLRQTPIEITVTPQAGGPEYHHVLPPLATELEHLEPLDLELAWIERDQGWCIRLALPEDARPGTYLVEGKAVSPERQETTTLEGLPATRTTKWNVSVRIWPGAEIFINFGESDAHTIDLLRHTPVQFYVTPLAGGGLQRHTLAGMDG